MAIERHIRKGVKIIVERKLIPLYRKFMHRFVKEPTRLVFKEHNNSISVSMSSASGYTYDMNYGINFLYNIFKYDGRVVSKKQFYDDVPNIILVLYGSYFHETSHLIFTDMTSLDRIAKLPQVTRPNGDVITNTSALVYMLMNILEDIVIESAFAYKFKTYKERRGVYDYSSPGNILKRNRKFIMTPDSLDYQDNNDIVSLYNFILFKLSLGKDFKGTNHFFSSHKENLEYVNRFLKETNGSKRVDIAIEYFNWIASTDLEIPAGEDGSSVDIGIPSTSGSSDSKGEDTPANSSSSMGDDSSGASIENEDYDTPEDKEDENKSGNETVPSVPEREDDLYELLNDENFDWSIHREIALKDVITTIDVDSIDEIEKEMSYLSENLSHYFSMLLEKSKPRYLSNLKSGSRLNIQLASKGERLKIFEEKLDRNKQLVSGITLLCDNSGSMTGTKSVILQKSVIAMSRMMSNLGIENSVYAFSDAEYSNIVTMKLKGFEDDYEDPVIKNNFNVLSTNTYNKFNDEIKANGRFSLFYGNEDAYHIDHLSRMLMNSHYDNKILIVFSDGAPMDSALLKKTVDKYQNEFTIIGVGLVDNSVKRFYTQNKVFSTIDELTNLPDWLGEILKEILI